VTWGRVVEANVESRVQRMGPKRRLGSVVCLFSGENWITSLEPTGFDGQGLWLVSWPGLAWLGLASPGQWEEQGRGTGQTGRTGWSVCLVCVVACTLLD
jgi:hypothetical protein